MSTPRCTNQHSVALGVQLGQQLVQQHCLAARLDSDAEPLVVGDVGAVAERSVLTALD